MIDIRAVHFTRFSDITTDYRERRFAYAGTGAFDSATRAFGSQTIRQFYYEEQSNSRAVHAIAFLNSANDWHGAQVSVDPSYVLGAAESDLAAMLVHETIHTTTGLTDDAMDARIEEFSPGFTVKPGQNLKSEFIIKSNCLK